MLATRLFRVDTYVYGGECKRVATIQRCNREKIMSAPSREADKSMIRFPPSMKSELKEFAHANYRSLNAEIIARLRRDMDREKEAAPTFTSHAA